MKPLDVKKLQTSRGAKIRTARDQFCCAGILAPSPVAYLADCRSVCYSGSALRSHPSNFNSFQRFEFLAGKFPACSTQDCCFDSLVA